MNPTSPSNSPVPTPGAGLSAFTTDYSLTAVSRTNAVRPHLELIAMIADDLDVPVPGPVAAALAPDPDAAALTAAEAFLADHAARRARADAVLDELHRIAPLDIDHLPGWHATPWSYALLHPWHPDLDAAITQAEQWLAR